MSTLVWDNVAGTFPTVNEIEVDKETGLNKNSQYSLQAPTGQRCRSAFVVGLISQVWKRRCQCRLFIMITCPLARVGLITPAARDAARRRQVAMRMEAQMKEERRAQWMASIQGPGWARRG